MAITVNYSPTGAVGKAAHASGVGARQRADQLERVRQQEVAAARKQQMDMMLMQLGAQRDSQIRSQQYGLTLDASRQAHDRQMLAARGELDAAARADHEARNERNMARQFDYNTRLANAADARRADEIERRAFNDLLQAENEAAIAAEQAKAEKLARNERYVTDYNFIVENPHWSDDQKRVALDKLAEKYLGIKDIPSGPTFREQVEQDVIHNEDGSMFIPDGVKYTPPPKAAAQMVTSQQDFGKMWIDARKALTYKDESTNTMVVPTADDIRAEVKAMQDEYRAMVKAYEGGGEEDRAPGDVLGEDFEDFGTSVAPGIERGPDPTQTPEALEMSAEAHRVRAERFAANLDAALQDPTRYPLAGSHQEIARRKVAQAMAVMRSPHSSPAQQKKAEEILELASIATGVNY